MNELLQKLLEADVLSEDTKKDIETEFNSQVNEAKEAARTEEAANVRAELTEQWIEERDSLVEAIDSKVGDFLNEEVTELKADIERFRDLEAEYADKLVEAKASMKDELASDLEELVEKMNSFLEIRLAAEFEELKEDIDDVRKNEFGRKIFEAFSQEYNDSYQDEDSAEMNLAETKAELAAAKTELAESVSRTDSLTRTIKLEEILSPLSGRQKEVMEAILKTVDTDDLENGYKTFIGRVVREAEEDSSEKESDKVLAESADVDGNNDADADLLAEGDIATGDVDDVITESEENIALKQEIAAMKKLAGIE